jgi:hypothetical protein
MSREGRCGFSRKFPNKVAFAEKVWYNGGAINGRKENCGK